MKNIFLLCIATFFLFSCTEKKVKTVDNDLTESKIKGHVKSIYELSYTVHDSAGQAVKEELIYTRHLVFDQKGNLIEDKDHGKGDSTSSIQICVYDSNEHLVKDSGNMSMVTIWNIYRYDGKGNQIEQDEYSLENGKAECRTTEIYKVDEKGNKIEEDTYWGNKDSLMGKMYAKYNDNNQETENTRFHSKGGQYFKMVRLFDKKNTPVEYQYYYYTHDTLERKSIYKYDSMGNQTEGSNYKKDGSLSDKALFKFDNKGNMIETKLINSDGSVSAIISDKLENFDKEGNWLKYTSFNSTKGGKPTNIIERTITYY